MKQLLLIMLFSLSAQLFSMEEGKKNLNPAVIFPPSRLYFEKKFIEKRDKLEFFETDFTETLDSLNEKGIIAGLKLQGNWKSDLLYSGNLNTESLNQNTFIESALLLNKGNNTFSFQSNNLEGLRDSITSANMFYNFIPHCVDLFLISAFEKIKYQDLKPYEDENNTTIDLLYLLKNNKYLRIVTAKALINSLVVSAFDKDNTFTNLENDPFEDTTITDPGNNEVIEIKEKINTLKDFIMEPEYSDSLNLYFRKSFNVSDEYLETESLDLYVKTLFKVSDEYLETINYDKRTQINPRLNNLKDIFINRGIGNINKISSFQLWRKKSSTKTMGKIIGTALIISAAPLFLKVFNKFNIFIESHPLKTRTNLIGSLFTLSSPIIAYLLLWRNSKK